MDMKRCSRGHTFDGSKYAQCPFCPVPGPTADTPDSAAPKLTSLRQPDAFGLTRTIFRPTEPVAPVVGWLVCVDGPTRGTDYRIRDGINRIGRSNEMQICIQDDAIAREDHAAIRFDSAANIFELIPGSNRWLVYLNGQSGLSVLEPQILAPFSQITLGRSVLLFVPLCGETFRW